jgi:redox-sensitive bicupin YhaK (pirin superfamily)
MDGVLLVRRDREIYRTDGGWFSARWHFSFDQYHDPQNMGWGPLRVFNDDRLVPGAEVKHPFGEGRGGYLYVISGDIELNQERLETGDAAKIRDELGLGVRAEEAAELILVDVPLD